MNRRGFLSSILALAAAPAIVRASSLMPIAVIDAPKIITAAGSNIWDAAHHAMREDLADIIYNISPMESPFFSNLQRKRLDYPCHEWIYESTFAQT